MYKNWKSKLCILHNQEQHFKKKDDNSCEKTTTYARKRTEDVIYGIYCSINKTKRREHKEC